MHACVAFQVLKHNYNYIECTSHLPPTLPTASPALSELPKFPGYKLVGDNIDKGVKARYMRADHHHNKSLHYFHSFAVANRVDFSSYSDVRPSSCVNSPKHRAAQLLPSQQDDKAIRNNFIILVSRILVDNIPFFMETFDGVVTRHIKHKYFSEMATKSHVVGKQPLY